MMQDAQINQRRPDGHGTTWSKKMSKKFNVWTGGKFDLGMLRFSNVILYREDTEEDSSSGAVYGVGIHFCGKFITFMSN